MKRILDFEIASLGDKPFLSIRRVKMVVRDFPHGVGPGCALYADNCCHTLDKSSNELLESDETTNDTVCSKANSIGSQQVDKPVSVGQSAGLII
uniref:Uncharacterized protein n=1 Tax=Cannabis sativa TaxID=3483 RepID=A0A803NME5_CANSA